MMISLDEDYHVISALLSKAPLRFSPQCLNTDDAATTLLYSVTLNFLRRNTKNKCVHIPVDFELGLDLAEGFFFANLALLSRQRCAVICPSVSSTKLSCIELAGCRAEVT